MRVYVIGAGVSCKADYPLGGELLGALRKYVDEYPVANKQQWAELLDWLKNNANPDVRMAYAQDRLEHIFTILDLNCQLRKFAPDAAFRSLSHEPAPIALAKAEGFRSFLAETVDAEKHRQSLLRVLGEYFNQRHLCDFDAGCSPGESSRFSVLDRFGKRKICSGDVLITFNYDALLERVLLQQDKWFPSDGYGFQVPLQATGGDQLPINKESSAVTVLKLHGSIGWHAKGRSRAEDDSGSDIGPDESLDVEHEAPIVLDPIFLHYLGLTARDSRYERYLGPNRQVLIHPTFLKNYESAAFAALWRRAAEALRNAAEVAVVGYSLPAEDSAALTLLQTNCDPGRVTIVNNSATDCQRLRQLLAGASGPTQCLSFEKWLEEGR